MQRPTRISRRDNIDATCRKPDAPVKFSAKKGQIVLGFRFLSAIRNECDEPPDRRTSRHGLPLACVWQVATDRTCATIGGKHGRVAQPQVELQSDLGGTVTCWRHGSGSMSRAFAPKKPVSAAMQDNNVLWLQHILAQSGTYGRCAASLVRICHSGRGSSVTHGVGKIFIQRPESGGDDEMRQGQLLDVDDYVPLCWANRATVPCFFAGMAIRGGVDGEPTCFLRAGSYVERRWAPGKMSSGLCHGKTDRTADSRNPLAPTGWTTE